ncbi:ATP-binding cassette domain-containing protein [Granulicatella sp. zg-ZJ]|uniref:ABC transporter ATP-binding protein n=1 Tax=unclassified Granulicatella TaxID=2630493 RepID=UPI0013C1214B|nr:MULTISPECIES: ATP-binding cassette domain-containing protein [unclassified Granulicatella]MBS4749687.1 ATP-binding cassette domain-containing protein [Carnobacteriaceae bacterium zg-ZUI78]NEW61816.1 ATP-binding cassette domain-containing protein [Granulicatella sp. zg-ZJ]NEW65890.1 ATP-binding cassette domain-containing protein [Granulicatella sp. zg-84]QMI85119.1 ATP-binding cassette domain-containing protein [Carnobacteriaceae bacterium zg-84]
MIECQHIYKSFQGKEILKDCHFHIKKGEIIGIMGESGSGKSTLAKILIGLEKATKGQVLLDGKPYCVKKDGVRILLVFQDAFHAVNPLFTVKQILCEALKETIQMEEISAILKDVGLDDTYLEKTSKELSGGQLQRICIARALLLKPDVIIFDEALSGLDPLIQGQLLKLLYDLKARYNQTYVFISHDFNLCYAICHRVLVMFEGEIVDEINDFNIPMNVTHPVTQNLLKESQNPKYSKCQLRKIVVKLESQRQNMNGE